MGGDSFKFTMISFLAVCYKCKVVADSAQEYIEAGTCISKYRIGWH
jgi:hypothetical protein